MLVSVAVAAALLPLSWAFQDTAPCVAWSSHESSVIRSGDDRRPSSVADLMTEEDICDFDAVVILNQPELRAHDLKALPSSHVVSSRLRSSHSSSQHAYLQQHSQESIADAAQILATRCGSSMRWLSEGGEFDFDEGYKHVVHVSLPEASGMGSWRKSAMKELEEPLVRLLSSIESTFKKHIVIYTGSSSPSSLSKRQSIPVSDPFASLQDDDTSGNGTFTGGTGLLAHYQFLTPGLIITLFVAFFLMIPIVLGGTRAVASIQSSVQLEAPKGPSQAKKNQ